MTLLDAVPARPRPPGPADVAVIVVTHDSADVVGGCLDALPLALAGIARSEVTVVDNASSDGTAEVVAARPGVAFLPTGRNDGYAAAVNAGVEAATAGAYLILNPDVRLAPGAVARLLRALEAPGVGVAAPHLVDGAGCTLASLHREPTVGRALGEAVLGGGTAGRIPALGESLVPGPAYRRPATVAWASGAALLVSAACAAEVGRWDESYFLYSEEVEFQLRARDHGFATAYVPEAEGVHLGGESHTSPALWARLTANRVRCFRRRHAGGRAAAFHVAVLAGELARSWRGDTHRAAVRALLRPTARVGAPTAAPPVDAEHPPWICFSAQDWWVHSHAHSDPQLMARIARDRRVLLVNSIGMRMPRRGRSTTPLRRVARKAGSVARLVRRPLPDVPGFHVMTPVVVPWYGSAVGRALNATLVRAQVAAVTRALGMRRPVALVTIPTAWDVVRRMDTRRLVVNRSDKYSAFREADGPVIEALERDLLAAADDALYVSRTLLEDEADLVGGRAEFLDHGVDVDRFRPGAGPEPAALAGCPRPRIGYVGAINATKVDLDLIAAVADALPEASVVLVGPSEVDLDALVARPNVTWVDQVPHDAVPAVVAHLDVSVMPWQDNEWIRHANPIKLKEHLAVGVPIVSTPLPEVDRYAGLVRVAAGQGAFIAQVREALAEDDPGAPGRRRAAVLPESWDRRAARLRELGEQG